MSLGLLSLLLLLLLLLQILLLRTMDLIAMAIEIAISLCNLMTRNGFALTDSILNICFMLKPKVSQ